MSRVNSENYIVIQGWMLTDLNLKGNELLVYAIIYGFSQNGDGQRYTGSLQYLADWTNSTKQGIVKNLKTLLDKGLIAKEEKIINGVKFCEYYTTKFNRVVNSVEQGMQQSLPEGIQQSCNNNIASNNIEENPIENIEDIPPPPPPMPPPEKPEKSVRHKKGEYGHVLLTIEQEDKLIKEYGEIVTVKAIQFLDEYIEMKGYKAKNHYLAIRKWVVDAVKEQEQKRAKNGQLHASSFDADDFFQAACNRWNETTIQPKTIGQDASLRERANALKERLQ